MFTEKQFPWYYVILFRTVHSAVMVETRNEIIASRDAQTLARQPCSKYWDFIDRIVRDCDSRSKSFVAPSDFEINGKNIQFSIGIIKSFFWIKVSSRPEKPFDAVQWTCQFMSFPIGLDCYEFLWNNVSETTLRDWKFHSKRFSVS